MDLGVIPCHFKTGYMGAQAQQVPPAQQPIPSGQQVRGMSPAVAQQQKGDYNSTLYGENEYLLNLTASVIFYVRLYTYFEIPLLGFDFL